MLSNHSAAAVLGVGCVMDAQGQFQFNPRFACKSTFDKLRDNY